MDFLILTFNIANTLFLLLFSVFEVYWWSVTGMGKVEYGGVFVSLLCYKKTVGDLFLEDARRNGLIQNSTIFYY